LKVSTYKLICEQQRSWAKKHDIKFDKDGYTYSLKDNLYILPSSKTITEFTSGRGGELGSDQERGKMQALHSSSAFVVNFFECWRNSKHITDIALSCGALQGMKDMHFEQIHPTPLGGIPPHIDVEFCGNDLRPFAIESKFTELYHRHTKRMIKEKYFNMPDLWKELPKCENLAMLIHDEERGRTSFSYLDAPQLLKHILGLTAAFGATGFDLLYLWYEEPSLEANIHREELEKFKKYVGNEINFHDMTYQELFKTVRKSGVADRGHISYLSERYFPHTLDYA
jgi:hypothetical protein